MTDNEILNLALESGIIDLAPICAKVEELQRQQYLKMHTSKVWQGSNQSWYTYLDYSEGRKLVKKKSKSDLDNTIIEFYKKKCKSPTVYECYHQWATAKLEHGEIQRQTFDRYENDFKRFLNPISHKQISDITEDMLYDYILDTISEQNLTAKAWAGMRTLILGIFKYAKRKKYTKISISAFMSDLDISKGAFRKRRFTDAESVFTDDEVKTIKQSIADEGYTILNLGVLLAFETGMRCGEISALEYKDLQGNVLNVSKTEIFYKGDGITIYEVRDSTKGKYDARKVVLTQDAKQIIERARMMNPNGKYLLKKMVKEFTEKRSHPR